MGMALSWSGIDYGLDARRGMGAPRTTQMQGKKKPRFRGAESVLLLLGCGFLFEFADRGIHFLCRIHEPL